MRLTPLTALEFERIAREAGIPEGVVNVLVGPGSVVGQRLVEHEDVAKVAFTGSTAVGHGIMAGASGTIKRVTLELGGKSANIVFADADLEAAGLTVRRTDITPGFVALMRADGLEGQVPVPAEGSVLPARLIASTRMRSASWA